MIELTIINILGVAVMGNMLAHWFTPIQEAKRRFIAFFRRSDLLFNAIHTTLNCSKCLTFWLAIILFQNFLVAALCSLLGYLVNHLIDKVEAWYE